MVDIAARTALEAALENFDGTLIVVSHDRYFLDTVCERLWIVEDGRVGVFVGTYSEYANRRREETGTAVAGATGPGVPPTAGVGPVRSGAPAVAGDGRTRRRAMAEEARRMRQQAARIASLARSRARSASHASHPASAASASAASSGSPINAGRMPPGARGRRSIDDPRVEHRHRWRAVERDAVLVPAGSLAVHARITLACRLPVAGKHVATRFGLERHAALRAKHVRLPGLVGDDPDDVVSARQDLRMVDRCRAADPFGGNEGFERRVGAALRESGRDAGRVKPLRAGERSIPVELADLEPTERRPAAIV